MRSIVAVTNEIDDVQAAVAELQDQIMAQGGAGKNSCGIVYCDVEMPHEDFMRAIKEKLPFEVIGCTTIASFDTNNGATILSAVLILLTGDDVKFGVSLTGPLTSENLRKELETACKAAEDVLGEHGKLMFLMPPYENTVPLDEYVNILSEFSGNLPIFGGLPSSSVADGEIFMYADGRVFGDRAAILLIGGDVRPVFSVQNFLSELSEQKYIVTSAEKNIVRKVGDMTFVDFLKHLGLPADDLIAHGDMTVYASTPLKVYMSMKDERDKIPIARTIKELNPEDGSGVLFGEISEKSAVTIVTMKRKDIVNSCKAAMAEITEKINAASGDDYKYSTLFCVSCGGRYLVMGDDKDTEGDVITKQLPQGISLSGFYAYGEICPTLIENGKALNRVHNESIVMCAM